jgi:Fe2+ or Zn2+ uptake regulation protein
MQTEIQDRLQKGGVKPSMQRMAIMKELMIHPVHPTVDMIYTALSPSIPTLSKTTVYSTLRLFSEQEIIKTISIDEKNLRYDANLTPHAHFKCKKCGNVHDLWVEGLDSIKIKNGGSLEITDTQLYYSGYCENCTDKKRNHKRSINFHIL